MIPRSHPEDRVQGRSRPRRPKAPTLQSSLLSWFARERRPLPWRENYDPYRVWISEIMLQQTQVETMLPYYERWMVRFPDVAAVAAAPLQVVLKVWEGLGYYSRARSLHRAAKELVRDHGGAVPGDVEALRALPGIGPYTAGAIASIAFNLPVPAVDGNVARVLARLFVLARPVNSPAGNRKLWELAKRLLPRQDARNFNQALMELGALICRVRKPKCGICPLASHCKAWARGTPEAWPRRLPRPEKRLLSGVMLVVVSGGGQGRVLVRRRPAAGLWGGLWEFPWLERKRGESGAAATRRLLDGLGLNTAGGGSGFSAKKIGKLRHGLTHLIFELDCRLVSLDCAVSPDGVDSPELAAPPAGPPNGDGQPRRWVTARGLEKLPLARLCHKARALWQTAAVPEQGALRRRRPVGKRPGMV